MCIGQLLLSIPEGCLHYWRAFWGKETSTVNCQIQVWTTNIWEWISAIFATFHTYIVRWHTPSTSQKRIGHENNFRWTKLQSFPSASGHQHPIGPACRLHAYLYAWEKLNPGGRSTGRADMYINETCPSHPICWLRSRLDRMLENNLSYGRARIFGLVRYLRSKNLQRCKWWFQFKAHFALTVMVPIWTDFTYFTAQAMQK